MPVFSCKSDTELPPEPDPVPPMSLREQYGTAVERWPAPELFDGIIHQELAPLPPPANEAETREEVAYLGKVLFFDVRVGRKIAKSCASCHNPELYWTDRVQVGTLESRTLPQRNSPSMENVHRLRGNLFWDGRAEDFHEQISEAIESPIEMRHDLNVLPDELAAIQGYRTLFKDAFGDETITADRLLEAISVYSQTIVSGETPFDRFMKGDYAALTDQQIEGLHLFRTKAKCINCHNGPYLSDLQYHNLGYAVDRTGKLDHGRFMATGLESDKGKFRTPGLRNVANTWPYMHNGAVESLTEMVELINLGMPQKARQQVNGELSPFIRPLRLTRDEQQAIIAFLNSLSSERPNIGVPEIPR